MNRSPVRTPGNPQGATPPRRRSGVLAIVAAVLLVIGAGACSSSHDDNSPGTGSAGSGSGKNAGPAPLKATAHTISAGYQLGCQVVSGGVRCWGDNSSGAIGTGSADGPDTCKAPEDSSGHGCAFKAVTVPGLSGVQSISVGSFTVCALLKSGDVACWGNNQSGTLGNKTTGGPQTCTNDTPCSTSPTLVPGLHDVTAVSVGTVGGIDLNTDACAVTKDGRVHCWGDNIVGQLGIGTTKSVGGCRTHGLDAGPCAFAPVEVRGISNAVDVSVGGAYACALLKNGHVRCWGANNNGTVGTGTPGGPRHCFQMAGVVIDCAAAPRPVVGLADVVEIAAGGVAVCARTKDSKVLCWGGNRGQLGVGTDKGPETCKAVQGFDVACSSRPVQVKGLTQATSLSSGGASICATTKDGHTWCWGQNDTGTLGVGDMSGPEQCTHVDGTADNGEPCSTAPVQVVGVDDATQVAAGFDTTCVARANDVATCWGNNASAGVGSGTTGGPDDCQLNAFVNDPQPECYAKPADNVAAG